MTRLYSGNLDDHMQATKALRSMGFRVLTTEGYNRDRQHVLTSTISLLDGDTLITKTFKHYDIDCVYIECTLWLREMHKQLKDW